MSRLPVIPGIVWYCSAAVFLVLLIVLAGIQITQHILLARAERLLTDIRSLELRKASFTEAQAAFRPWSRWGHYDGDCNAEHCEFDVRLQDFSLEHQSMFGGHIPLIRGYMLIGGRPARVDAGLTVRNGLVWDKNFSITEGITAQVFLIGVSKSNPRFDRRNLRSNQKLQLDLHPNYITETGGCELDCVIIESSFTPYADPADVLRLMQFNLSCLTRWRSCQKTSDIMPAAFAQLVADSQREN